MDSICDILSIDQSVKKTKTRVLQYSGSLGGKGGNTYSLCMLLSRVTVNVITYKKRLLITEIF